MFARRTLPECQRDLKVGASRHIHYFDIVHLLCGGVGRYVQKSELRWMFLRSALALTGIGVLIGLGLRAG
jgi:hypothetical protein